MLWTVLGRMLWARRAIIIVAMACCLGGGIFVVVTVRPQYDATARVTLNNMTKPDPVSGMTVSVRGADAYVKTQIGMIRDVQVVGPALEAIGWMDDPDLLAAYAARPPNDTRDLGTWISQRIIPGIAAYLVEDSNVLEIRYRGGSPELAKLVVGALRDAYITTSVADRREGALRDAEFQQKRADVLRAELEVLQDRQAELERAAGIVLQAGGQDLDSRRLSQLASPARPVVEDMYMMAPSPAKAALAQLDSDIAKASETLGPNHPRLVQMRRARAMLEQTAQREGSAGEAARAAVAAKAQADAAVLAAQTNKVLSQRKDLVELKLMQDRIAAKSKAYAEALRRMAGARQLALTDESGLTAVGEVESIPGAAFPNKALILGGTGGFGLLAGLLLALLVELLGLRVRTQSGLLGATQAPILGSIPRMRGPAAPEAPRRRRLGWGKPKPAAA